MFIAVTKEIFQWYFLGKEYELRASRKRFTSKTLKKGMIIKIGEGYSGKKFRAKLVDMVFASSIEKIFDAIPYRKINPVVGNRREAIKIAKQTCGKGKMHVAMKLKKI